VSEASIAREGDASAEVSALRARYDDEMRRRASPPAGLRLEEDGPLTRMVGPGPHPLDHMVCHSRLAAGEAEGVVAREVARVRAERRGLQWNVHGHDEPRDLEAILGRAGLRATSHERILASPADDPRLAEREVPGVTVRRAASPAEVDDVMRVQEAVWGTGHSEWLRRWLLASFLGEGDPVAIFVARAGSTPVGIAWTALHPGRTFAGLYGGTVVPAARNRGVHRRLVAARARAAREAGLSQVVAGANEHSAPRLLRLGFLEIATCVEMVLDPPP
jgi:ribosomal protein S18 acetylase RimI-like enzyme